MPTKEIDPANLGMDEDWQGNNAAFRCPVCSKVFIVNNVRMGLRDRSCPNCGKSVAHMTGTQGQGKKSGKVKVWIEW